MLVKKFALGFGIAVIFPLMIHYGVRTFSPLPLAQNYQIENYYKRFQSAPPEEKVRLEKEKAQLENKERRDYRGFQRSLFFVAVPVGIAAIIIGLIMPIHSVGTGFMFGGILTLIDGYVWYWFELQDWMRFLSLLVALIILIFVGHQKFSEKEKK
ncbi:MAG: hypothetical protein PHS93_06430 [Candidatus Omnitrophica bacterium]|nr:hypothetical protein [Candidatus Omnitrophota bacterium]MDD5352785.1 hypothetical protein [Candidatus Omnitrophota bacterium]MDD5550384.1 hypothetical protein [Candidatus Omnitrophota bacterium]